MYNPSVIKEEVNQVAQSRANTKSEAMDRATEYIEYMAAIANLVFDNENATDPDCVTPKQVYGEVKKRLQQTREPFSERMFNNLIDFKNTVARIVLGIPDKDGKSYPYTLPELAACLEQGWGHYTALCKKFDDEQSQLTEHAIDHVVDMNPRRSFLIELESVTQQIFNLLSEKNLKYGDSALNPSGIFARGLSAIDLINARMDDKLARLKNGAGEDDEDPEWDLIGYLVLKRIAINRQKSVN